MIAYQDRKILGAIRLFQAQKDRPGPLAWGLRSYAKLQHHIWTTISGADVNRDAHIDPSVRMPHPNGIVIHQSAVVERDCMIMQQVTLGQLATGNGPHLQRDVYVGAGAKLLGPITIGEGARIGANAVVLEDVPSFATAVGAPARIILRSDES